MDRAEVMAWAERHGAQAAAQRYGVPAGTIRSWRSRARQRAARYAAQRQESAPTPREAFEDRAAQLAAWAARGACLHCGGVGTVQVPTATRGRVVIRYGRAIDCPTCGGIPKRVQVNELPREEWAEGMRVAGDMGIGWTAEEWAERQAGNPNPGGWRWTHHDWIEVGPDGPVGPGERRR
jgi:transposase